MRIPHFVIYYENIKDYLLLFNFILEGISSPQA
jgi:hypothetical protein